MDNPLTVTTDQNRFRFALEFIRPEDAPQDVARLQADLEPFLEDHSLGARENYAVALAAEELLLNIAKYGGASNPSGYPLRCHGEIAIEQDRIVFTLADNGIPFDPRESPPPPLDLPPEERPIGGLGIHMMKQYFSGLDYRRENGENRSVWTTELPAG